MIPPSDNFVNVTFSVSLNLNPFVSRHLAGFSNGF